MPPKNTSNKRPRVVREPKNKGKATTSSESNSIEYQKHFTFTNRQQYSNFIEHYSNLDIITPRYLPRAYVEEKGYNRLLPILLRGNWFEFLGKEVPYIQDTLIRMFYGNMRKEASNDDEDGELLYTIVNGVRINITDSLIHDVSGLPMTPTIKKDFDERTLLTSLGVQPYDRRPTIVGMNNDEGRLLHYLVLYCIHPRFSSRSKITQDDSFVMFNFLHNKHFNWCHLIKTHMWYMSTHREVLGYAPLIMDILRDAGIRTEIPKLITPRTATWIISDKTFKNKGPTITIPPPPPPTTKDHIDLSKVQMRDLAMSLNSLHVKMDNVMGRMGGIESFLTQQFGYNQPPPRHDSPPPPPSQDLSIVPFVQAQQHEDDPYTDEEV